MTPREQLDQLVHDLNSALAIIMASAEMEQNFPLILKASVRMRGTIRELAAFTEQTFEK